MPFVNNFIQILLIGIGMHFWQGCQVQQQAAAVNSMDVHVNSLGQFETNEPAKYLLRPFDSTYGGDFLLYDELQKYVIKGINKTGLVPTSNIDSANYIFYFDFGTSDPEKYEYEISEGVYNKIGTAKLSSKTDIYLNYYPGYTIMKTQRLNHSTTATYRTETRHGHINIYTHYFILSCFDREKMKSDFNTSVVWKMKADSQVRSKDIRIVMPYVIAGSHTLFGKNTGKAVTRQVYLSPEFYPEIFSNALAREETDMLLSDEEINIRKAIDNFQGKACPSAR
jgi:hypothetical protein